MHTVRASVFWLTLTCLLWSSYSGRAQQATPDEARQRAVALYRVDPSAPREPLFTSFDGTKIHYQVQGKGKPVVLVHGFIVHSATWPGAPLYQQLLDHGYRVITLDLRGNGKSDRPHQLSAYRQDAEARDIMGLMKHLGIQKYAAVGYSRGAIITARLLVLDPNVKAAVLGGMGAHFTNPDWPRRVAFANAFLGKAPPQPMTAGAMQFARSIGADTLALGYMQEAQPVTSPRELRAVKQPVLVISGDQDSDNGPATELAAMLGNATLATVPGDHNGTLRTEAFAAKVLQFLQTHERTPHPVTSPRCP